MCASTQAPFIYGRPVQGEEFLNRHSAVRTVMNRLRNGDSTAIVGEPHIGKSSLLMHLNKHIYQEHKGSETDQLISTYMDLQPIASNYATHDFWKEMFEPLETYLGNTSIPLLKQTADSAYQRRPMERLLDHVSNRRLRLVLLLDEFERLLRHPNFQDGSFYAQLRSLASRNRGLSIVVASRLSLAELNEHGCNLLPGTSPLFNFMIEVPLYPFDDIAVSLLLERAGRDLSSDDRQYICRIAGRHPFLLQAMSAAFLETTGKDRQIRAAEVFYSQISSHFDDLWNGLDDSSRTTAVILSLIEFGKRTLGQKFACGEIENVAAFGPQLRKLAERGLAEKVSQGWQFDQKNLLLWRGEKWEISCQAFAWWIRDTVIAETRPVQTYKNWLADKRYTLLLTQRQWNWLTSTVRNAPDWALRGVAGLARSVFEEVLGRK